MTGIKPHRAVSPATKKAVLIFCDIESFNNLELQRSLKEFYIVC